MSLWPLHARATRLEFGHFSAVTSPQASGAVMSHGVIVAAMPLGLAVSQRIAGARRPRPEPTNGLARRATGLAPDLLAEPRGIPLADLPQLPRTMPHEYHAGRAAIAFSPVHRSRCLVSASRGPTPGPAPGTTAPRTEPAVGPQRDSGWTTQQDHRNMMEQLGIKALRPGPSGRAGAPNSANYDPAKANPFPDLPEPLTLKNGQKVTTAEMWWKQRRPEIVEDFEREVIGRVPKNVPKVTWIDHDAGDGSGRGRHPGRCASNWSVTWTIRPARPSGGHPDDAGHTARTPKARCRC